MPPWPPSPGGVTALYFRPLFAVSRYVPPRACGNSTPPLSWNLFEDILGPNREHIIYLPASRFWPVQGIESGIFLVLALALSILRTGRSPPAKPDAALAETKPGHLAS